MKTLLLTLLLVPTFSFAAESRFFANDSVQRQAPQAFILQPESANFILEVDAESVAVKRNLIQAIKANTALYTAIRNWETLSIEEQIPYLKQVFDIEVKAMKIRTPELIIGSEAIPDRPAFFDFDVKNPGPGKIMLNPKELATMDKYASLALLIHETRHAAQFQKAFLSSDKVSSSSVAYKASFEAQKNLQINSFCDFLTLANEHEAFEFGNYILGSLTDWKVDMPDMGTYASQYDSHGSLKLDLNVLLQVDPTKSLLEKFNDAELAQCKLLGACR